MRTVPKCPVPLNETVQDGTRQYEVLVLPCMVSFRGTGLFRTSIYCLVLWYIHLRISKKFHCLKAQWQYMLVYASIYWCIPACTSIYQYIPNSKSMYWFTLAHYFLYLHMPVYTSIHQHIPVHTGIFKFWYVLIYTGMYWYVLVYTGMYQSRSEFKNGANQIWTSNLLHTFWYAWPLHCESTDAKHRIWYITKVCVHAPDFRVPVYVPGSWWRIDGAGLRPRPFLSSKSQLTHYNLKV